jgi:hypothetical protein
VYLREDRSGPRSPGFWREYKHDMIMTLHESEDWEKYDTLDQKQVDELNKTEDNGYWKEKLSREMVLRWDSLDAEEKHDLEMVKQGRYIQLTKYTGRESIKRDEKGRRRRKKRKDTSDTLLYVDDLGARESAETIEELEEKKTKV